MGSETIIAEPLQVLGVCTCCLADGPIFSMLEFSESSKTSYYKMLTECFSLNELVVGGDVKLTICGQCIHDLTSAYSFRNRVIASFDSLQAVSADSYAKQKIEVVSNANNNDLDDQNIYWDDPSQPSQEEHNSCKSEDLTCKQEDTTCKSEELEHGTRKFKVSKKRIAKAVFVTLLENGCIPFRRMKPLEYVCRICPEECTDLDEMQKHVLTHDEEKIIKAFRKSVSLVNAQFTIKDQNLLCSCCRQTIVNFRDMKMHAECIERPKADQFDCPICKQQFYSYTTLTMHMNNHYPDYVCDFCGKPFASKGRLQNHMRRHRVGNFPCKICGETFDQLLKREKHKLKMHGKKNRYVCKECDIEIPSFYARQKHLAEYHNAELKRYKCKACEQCFVTPGHLSVHVRRDHLNERNHKCSMCDLAFYSKHSLNMHMIKHNGARIYQCDVCSKSYQRYRTLKEHKKIHSNEKSHVCCICSRAFTQKCTLKTHMRVHEKNTQESKDLDVKVFEEDLVQHISEPLKFARGLGDDSNLVKAKFNQIL